MKTIKFCLLFLILSSSINAMTDERSTKLNVGFDTIKGNSDNSNAIGSEKDQFKRHFFDLSVVGGLSMEVVYPLNVGGLVGFSFGYEYAINDYFAFGAGAMMFISIIYNQHSVGLYFQPGVSIEGSGGSIMFMFMFGELRHSKIAFLLDVGGGWLGAIKLGIYVKGFVFKVGYSVTLVGLMHNVTFDIGYKFNFYLPDEHKLLMIKNGG